MSKINVIVAMGADRAIGRGGDLIWHLREDLKHFKALTMGHPVIMGRKTWESLPKGALPGRLNIVVSRNTEYHAPGATVCHSIEEALQTALQADSEPFIIGGGNIYAATLPLADNLHLTLVESSFEDADTFFPQIDESQFHLTEISEPATDPSCGLTYRFMTYEREDSNNK